MYRMKREQYSLTVIPAGEEPADPDVPTVRIDPSGSAATLRERLTAIDGSVPDGADVDVSFRKRDAETGALSITDRLTGSFIAELDAERTTVARVVEAAEANDGRYRLEIVIGDDRVTFEKGTLLVYDPTGQLRRSCSLIPGSVEL